MNMLNELKRISLKKVMPMFLICFIVGAFLLVNGGPGAIKFLLGGTDIYSIPVDELEGKYVSAELVYIMDSYAYTQKRSSGRTKTTAREYIIPVGTKEYMGVELPAKYLDQANDLMKATNDFIINENSFSGESFVVKGTIKQMSSQSKKYFYEAVGYNELDAETQKIMLPLVLEEGQIGDKSVVEVWLYTIGGLIVTTLGAFFLIRACTGNYQKSIKKYCASQPDPDLALAKLEDFYQLAAPLNGVRMDRNFIMLQDGATTKLLQASSLVWAYQQTTQHRTNGIPTGKSYSLQLYLDNGQLLAIGMKEKQAQEVLAAFVEHYPTMFVGFSKERAAMYKKDLEGFCKAARTLEY